MPRNTYKVPKKQWSKWTKEGRQTFNYIMVFMLPNQDLMLHPKALKNKPKYWKTTCWNAAWLAADSHIIFKEKQ